MPPRPEGLDHCCRGATCTGLAYLTSQTRISWYVLLTYLLVPSITRAWRPLCRDGASMQHCISSESPLIIQGTYRLLHRLCPCSAQTEAFNSHLGSQGQFWGVLFKWRQIKHDLHQSLTAALSQNTDLPPNQPVPTTLLSNSREKGPDRPCGREGSILDPCTWSAVLQKGRG